MVLTPQLCLQVVPPGILIPMASPRAEYRLGYINSITARLIIKTALCSCVVMSSSTVLCKHRSFCKHLVGICVLLQWN